MARNLARNLAHKLKSEETESRGRKPDNESGKVLLNRRKYLLLGGVTATTALGAGPSLVEASTSTSETFTTDFSGYV